MLIPYNWIFSASPRRQPVAGGGFDFQVYNYIIILVNLQFLNTDSPVESDRAVSAHIRGDEGIRRFDVTVANLAFACLAALVVILQAVLI
jgi:hypothetical protein